MANASLFILRTLIDYIREQYADNTITHTVTNACGMERHRFDVKDILTSVIVTQHTENEYNVHYTCGMFEDVNVRCDRVRAMYVVNALKEISKP